MKKIYFLFTVSVFTFSFAFASGVENNRSFWKDSDLNESRLGKADYTISNFRLMELDLQALKTALAAVPSESSVNARHSQAVFEFPLPDGNFGRFTVVESPVMAEELSAKYPEIKTYIAQGIDDPTANARIDITYWGFHAQIRSVYGTILIDPYNQQTSEHYMVYYKKDAVPVNSFSCEIEPANEKLLQEELIEETLKLSSSAIGSQLRTYRLALASTGEYSQFHGGTKPLVLSAMVTAMNRVNGIYEVDLGIRMILIPNNDTLIYLISSSDPYTNNNGGTMVGQNQTNIDNIIGNANYDIGHVFSTGGGGFAPGDVCLAGDKARAVTGLPSPIGDPFYVDYVAHEMGHQFSGAHTQNGTGCSGVTPTSAYEPGSASTIMGYAGICGNQNLQNNSDPYFHTRSFDQIVGYTTSGMGSTCDIVLQTGNNEPVIQPEPDYTIPYLTPFILTGSASDPDGDTLTYAWEQYDLGPSGHPNSPSGNAPIFRSFNPVLVPYRYFPKIQNIVNGNQTIGEILPSYARTLNFRLTARDNRAGGGGVAHNSVTYKVNVINTGAPFLVTSPNTNVTWALGTQETITWNVVGTDVAPINTPNVDIFLSTDGGYTYPVTLATNVPNNGSAVITVPNNFTTQARVMVRGAGNVFFDISNANFTIQIGADVNEILSGEIELYPNPALDYMNLILSEKIKGDTQINITDVTGRIIQTVHYNLTGKKENVILDVKSLSQGLYFVKIISPEGDAVKRFVKN